MIQRVLKLDSSPPAALSLRFFLSAPLFALLAGAVLLWEPEAFASRWSPAVLAATHLFALGVLTMVICGALLQLLPVVAGVAVPRAEKDAPILHALLCTGVLLLAGAFLLSAPLLFALALPALVLALGWLLIAYGAALWPLARNGAGRAAPMVANLRMGLISLAVTLAAGVAMALALGWNVPLPFPLPALADLHAMWGLLGWLGLLVAGVAWQVIPMFQGTQPYPPAVLRTTAILTPALLAACSAAQLAGHWIAAPLRTLLCGVFSLFGVITLRLVARRKRAPDQTTQFWRLSMASLLACAPAWYAPLDETARPLLLGVLFLPGFAGSAVNGMLYKIVPFLLWHHWQEHNFGRPVTSIRLIIPEARAVTQFRVHALAVALLALTALWPAWLLRPAALALVASNLLLGLNLLRAARCGTAPDRIR